MKPARSWETQRTVTKTNKKMWFKLPIAQIQGSYVLILLIDN